VRVLDALKRHARDAVIHVCASSEVFGRVPREKTPIDEECSFHPASPYAISKVGTDLVGRYYADYVRLMAHFDAVLPGRVHRVIHEHLLDDPDAEIRRLLAALGLPFEDACLSFHDNKRAVRTASSEQVRRPINRDGVGQWRPYSAWLDPLRAALGPILDAYSISAV